MLIFFLQNNLKNSFSPQYSNFPAKIHLLDTLIDLGKPHKHT